MTSIVRSLGLLVCASATACGAHAQERNDKVQLEASRDYLLGASVGSSRDPFGDSRRETRPGGIWAFQLGRFRFASSGASALLYQGRETVDSGVSTVLARSDKFSLNTSLSLDEGRDWADEDDPRFDGLPKIRSTVRGRVTLGYALGKRWSSSFRASQDLLGHGGGLHLDAGLVYRHPVSTQTHWDLAFGVGWGNGTYRQTHYGITSEGAANSGLPAYAIGAGFDSVSIGWRITSALSQRWVGYAGIGVSQLQGAVRYSPLTTHSTNTSANFGIAYRNVR
ncbi:MAG: MipA/OmpV family protein [Hydrogenophaga sp.]|uniref:MipA/OmpV family protein n=1 Tax=Hydrogenophaga sp. TaxID=1904254 RepID=UPI001D3FFCB1|nr:MipA/OmpV family protein [Hydrogenophaga sp.]MBX3609496.1 MipA/OmpV family protein [Hydrogenophaga sp.]